MIYSHNKIHIKSFASLLGVACNDNITVDDGLPFANTTAKNVSAKNVHLRQDCVLMENVLAVAVHKNAINSDAVPDLSKLVERETCCSNDYRLGIPNISFEYHHRDLYKDFIRTDHGCAYVSITEYHLVVVFANGKNEGVHWKLRTFNSHSLGMHIQKKSFEFQNKIKSSDGKTKRENGGLFVCITKPRDIVESVLIGTVSCAHTIQIESG